MATYEELHNIAIGSQGTDLRNKIIVAVAIKAHAILNSVSPSQASIDWATEALSDPASKTPEVLRYMLADNAGAAVGAITGAADATIQSAADEAIDKMLSL